MKGDGWVGGGGGLGCVLMSDGVGGGVGDCVGVRVGGVLGELEFFKEY